MYKLIDKYLEETICAVTFLLFVILSNVQVITRYILPPDYTIVWTEEIARYLFIWCMYIGISWCIKDDSHLKVDMIKLVISPKAHRALEIVISLVIVAFSAVMIFYGYKIFQKQLTFGQTLAASGLPMWLVYLCFPVSAVLVIARSIQRIFKLSRQGV
jgi:TRAP-type C4-dicarboxylate transport system permease small subunit